MTPWWITFEDGQGMCVEAPTYDEALALSATLDDRKIVSCNFLPYPASPRVGPNNSGCPAFCMRPKTCQGRTACPRDYACND